MTDVATSLDRRLSLTVELEPDEAPRGGPAASARQLSNATLATRGLLLTLGGLTVYALATMDSSVDLGKALGLTLHNFRLILLEPNTVRLSLLDGLAEIALTLALAFLTTLVSAAVSVALGLLAAENLSTPRATAVIKAVIALVRAVPTIIWVLIFAVSAGLGSTAAVIGLSFHSVSYLTKAYAESFEELDRGVIEALEASGANWLQIVFQAVLPSSATYLLSWTFLRFEINFANAVAVGAAAGAAGIGFDLFMASGFYFDLHELGLITYLILGCAAALEVAATAMKRRLQRGG